MTREQPDPWAAWSRIGDWCALAPGARLVIVKLSPDGSEAARYPGEVVAADRDGWYVVRATWAYRTIELDGLSFHAGDEMHEWFSPEHPFNAFAVYGPDGSLKGWYANVTYPARLDDAVAPPHVIWHDLYVDLVGLPDGTFTVRDDDELAASALSAREPSLHRAIVSAREELVKRFQARVPPFVDTAESVPDETILGRTCAGS